MTPHFGFVTVASILQDTEAMERLIAAYASALERVGGTRWQAEEASRAEPLVVLVATGGTEQRIVELLARRRTAVRDAPVLLVAHPAQNSLPAALETLARLQQDGTRGQILVLSSPEDEVGIARLEEAVHDVETHNALRRARIGAIGRPSEWLVASAPSPDVVRETWGPEVELIPMEALIDALETVVAAEIPPLVEELVASSEEVREPDRGDLAEAVRVTLALRGLVQRAGLSAVTLRCFDLVERLKTTGCLALARLNDEGIVAGCEGDLPSALGMLWATRLVGQPAWMANPAWVDEVDDTLWLAHCTVPRKLASRWRLRSHFESGLGVGLQGEIPPQPATLLRIGGARMERLWLAEGEIVCSGDAPDLCRTQVKVRLARGRTSELLRAPLGNHLVLVPGRHADRFRSWRESFLGARV
jgi:L-fucose isomerase-like protein